MPIAGSKPTVAAQQPTSGVIAAKVYDGIVTGEQESPIIGLLAYVDGAPLTVNYYSQILTSDTDVRAHDIGQVNIYQQYNKINNLEIRLDTAVNGSQITETSMMAVGGTAFMYPVLIPSVGDMFTAPAGQGQDGIYAITAIDRKSFNKNSVYSVDFILIEYITHNSTRLADMDSKSIREYFFDKERLIEGVSSTLTTNDYNNVIQLRRSVADMMKYYYKSFYNKAHGTLTIPGQQYPIYDHFLTSYLSKIASTDDALEVALTRVLPTDNDLFLAQSQFWDLLLDKDFNGLTNCNQVMGLVDTSQFSFNSLFRGLKFSRMRYVVYPLNVDYSIVTDNSNLAGGATYNPLYPPFTSPYIGGYGNTDYSHVKVQSIIALEEANSPTSALAFQLNNTFIVPGNTTPLIYPVLYDTHYVLSANFYNQTPNQSVLENLVSQYMQQKNMNLTDILNVANAYRTWGRLEQFYYMPILFTLMKEAMRSVFTI
jgi:hypothetical protein